MPCCGDLASNCVCSYVTAEPRTIGGTPLSDHRRGQLADIGIDESWIEGEATDEDAIEILAFHKFLNSGEWGTTKQGERIFIVDQRAHDYGTGKIDSKEFLDDSTVQDP